MSDRDRPAPLAPELVSLLDDERARPDAPSELQQRLFSRLQESIAHLDGGGDDGGEDDGGGDDGGGGASGGGGGASGAPTVASAAGGAGVIGALSAHPVALAITALAIGGVLGASLHWAVASGAPEPRIVYVDRTVTGPRMASSVEVAPSREEAPLASSLAAPPARLPTASSSALRSNAGAGTAAGRSADGQLGGERAILEIARTALGKGDYGIALETLDRHAQKYPTAQLAEEREALAIQCLVGLGRADAARARGERFRKSFPGSMLLPVVDAALR